MPSTDDDTMESRTLSTTVVRSCSSRPSPMSGRSILPFRACTRGSRSWRPSTSCTIGILTSGGFDSSSSVSSASFQSSPMMPPKQSFNIPFTCSTGGSMRLRSMDSVRAHKLMDSLMRSMTMFTCFSLSKSGCSNTGSLSPALTHEAPFVQMMRVPLLSSLPLTVVSPQLSVTAAVSESYCSCMPPESDMQTPSSPSLNSVGSGVFQAPASNAMALVSERLDCTPEG
mmetsp:Transcript_45030/g.134548  ORF Transcript_45030/g.134548 Transcript_45030/m.134548 type:complete len:227 (+) Transcript_45030:161-841(+)